MQVQARETCHMSREWGVKSEEDTKTCYTWRTPHRTARPDMDVARGHARGDRTGGGRASRERAVLYGRETRGDRTGRARSRRCARPGDRGAPRVAGPRAKKNAGKCECRVCFVFAVFLCSSVTQCREWECMRRWRCTHPTCQRRGARSGARVASRWAPYAVAERGVRACLL